MPHVLYVADCETTGFDPNNNEIIEVSFYRLSDDKQITVCIKPNNIDSITEDALRVNGHKLEDLLHKTEYGRQTYLEPSRALVQIEDFLMEDLSTTNERVLVGQNIPFDISFFKKLWERQAQSDTYPFGRMYMDTMQIAVFLDYINGTDRKGYHLGGLVKDFEVKKEKAHTAAGDVKMTKDLFLKQVRFIKNSLKATGE